VADPSGFQKGFATAEAQAKGFADNLVARGGVASQVLGTMGTAGLAAAAGIGVVTAAAAALGAALSSAVAQAVKTGSTINDMAAKTGIAAESLQRLKYAASLAGADLAGVASSVNKMQVAIVGGSSAFQRLGLDLAQLKRLAPEEQFAKVGAAINNLQTAAERATAAREIFGKAGTDNLALFASGMETAIARAQELGLVLSGATVAGLDATGDAADTLSQTWEGLWTNIGAAIATAPGVEQAINAIASAIGDLSTWVQDNQSILQGWITSVVVPLADIAVAAARGVLFMADAFKMLGDRIRSMPSLPDWLRSAGGAVSGIGGFGGLYDTYVKGSAGIDLGGLMGPPAPPRGRTGGQFLGKGVYDAAGKEAERARKEMEKTRLELQEFIDKWGSVGALNREAKPLGKVGLNTKVVQSQAKDELARYYEKVLADMDLMGDKFIGISGVIGQLGGVFEALGFKAESALGKITAGLGIAAQSAGGFIKSFVQFSSGNAFEGMLGMIGSGLGFLGGIFGLFGGGPSKEEIAAENKRKQDEAREAAGREQARINQLARESRAAGIGGIEEFGPAFFAQRPIATEADAQRQGAIFAAAWGAVVKDKGLAAASALFGETIKKMMADMGAAGIEIPDWLRDVSSLSEIGLDETFRNIAERGDTAAKMLKALGEAGVLGPELIGAFQDEARNVFAAGRQRALDMGKTEDEATKAGFAVANPLLKELANQAILQNQTLDEDIQAMIDEAGIVPDVEYQQLDELRRIREAVQALARTGDPPPGDNPPPPGDEPPPFDPKPQDPTNPFGSDSSSGGGWSSGFDVGGGITLPVTLNVDGRVFANTTARLIDRGVARSMDTAIARSIKRTARPS